MIRIFRYRIYVLVRTYGPVVIIVCFALSSVNEFHPPPAPPDGVRKQYRRSSSSSSSSSPPLRLPLLLALGGTTAGGVDPINERKKLVVRRPEQPLFDGSPRRGRERVPFLIIHYYYDFYFYFFVFVQMIVILYYGTPRSGGNFVHIIFTRTFPPSVFDDNSVG